MISLYLHMSDGTKKPYVLFDEMSEQDFKFDEKAIRVRDKPEYRENEWSGLSFENFKEIMANGLANTDDPDAEKEELRKCNESVNSVLEEQKTDPDYFEKLVTAQFTGLIVETVEKERWDK